MHKITVYLKDGRAIDISNLSAAAAVETLKAQGVKSADIAATVHQCDPVRRGSISNA